jgi:hypothetical protein
MVRKQIYIEKSDDESLKRQAAVLGISEAELIRRRIKRPLLTTISHPTRPEAWYEELSFIDERARLQDLKKTRGWTRDELYEERLERYSR